MRRHVIYGFVFLFAFFLIIGIMGRCWNRVGGFLDVHLYTSCSE